MLIGREREQRELQQAYDSDEAQFIAVYGRRRIGKTYLVRQTFKDKFTFTCSGQARGSMADQLFGWASSLRDAGLAVERRPSSWLEAFDLLKQVVKQAPTGKKVIFIDELPWFDTPRSGFVNALEFFWNGWASARDDVLLIVCGSATSWIVNKLFRNHGGLHNRVTHRLRINPFTLAECETYAQHHGFLLTRYDILETYMILGGVPFYWSMLETGRSVAQNIDALLFAAEGKLRFEFDELYHSLFKSPDRYIEIVKSLGNHPSGLSRQRIVQDTGLQSNAALTLMLDDLVNCGFIKAYEQYSDKRQTIYRLEDNFSLFYFKFIAGNAINDEQYWSHNYRSPQHAAWTGLAFERVCFQHVNQIKQALGIAGVASTVYSWQVGQSSDGSRGAQIDMIIDRSDNMVNLCEIKFATNEYVVSADDMTSLRNKAARFSESRQGHGKSVSLTMITANGMSHTAGYWRSIHNSVTADDLFQPTKFL